VKRYIVIPVVVFTALFLAHSSASAGPFGIFGRHRGGQPYYGPPPLTGPALPYLESAGGCGAGSCPASVPAGIMQPRPEPVLTAPPAVYYAPQWHYVSPPCRGGS
jgi:hypothetical protein